MEAVLPSETLSPTNKTTLHHSQQLEFLILLSVYMEAHGGAVG